MTILIALTDCSPFAYNFRKTINGGHCGNQVAAFAAVAAIDIVVDLGILTIPIPRVWELRLPLAHKLALIGIFGLGFVDVVMAVLRIVFDLRVNFQGDWTYTTAPLYFWSSMEPGLAIMVACAPILRPIFEKIVPAGLSSRTRSSSYPPDRYSGIMVDDRHFRPDGRLGSGRSPSTITAMSTPRNKSISKTETALPSPTTMPIPEKRERNEDRHGVINVGRDIRAEEERIGAAL